MIHRASHSCYARGCKEDACRIAHKIYMTRYRAARERRGAKHTTTGILGGHLMPPSGPTVRQVRQLVKKLTVPQIASKAGVNGGTVWELARQTRPRVHPRVAAAIAAVWADYCQPIDRLPRVPIGPLKEAIERVYGTPLERMKGERPPAPLAKVDVALISHVATLRVDRAEKICQDLGIYPEDVWGFEWFGTEEEAG